jgi:rod shape-determining protein MreC
MRNIILFIWRHNFTFLFLLLEILAFLLLFQTNRFHNASFYSWSNDFTGGIYQSISNVVEYTRLKQVNKSLAEENALFKTYQSSSYIELKSPIIFVNDTLLGLQYRYIPAKVIKSTIHKTKNYLILNQGKDQGIEPEMAVVCANGVVGIVKDVSDQFSSVLPIIHKDTKISGKIKKNNYFGIINWQGGDTRYAKLSDIPDHVELLVGDTIVTRGSSAIFPANYPIGTIESFKKPEGDNFYEIKIALFTNFQNISHVYVIKNEYKKEQLELEKLIMSNDD